MDNPADEPGDGGEAGRLSGLGLLETVTGRPVGETVETPRGAIPLDPALLSEAEISTLMGSEAYRAQWHDDAPRVREAVSAWFAATYPGPVRKDAGGRMVRTPDRRRPATAPAALKALGAVSMQTIREHTDAPAPPGPLKSAKRAFVQLVQKRRR